MAGRYDSIPSNSGNDPAEVECVLLGATEKAIRVALDEDDSPVWVPRSLIAEIVKGAGKSVTITIPTWFAEREGLI